MVRYPTPYLEGEGVITEVLGPRGQPGVDTLVDHPRLQHPRHLRRRRRSTRPASRPRRSREDDVGDRLDLRDVLTVTIDPATARDFDDAITLDARRARATGAWASTSPTSPTSSAPARRSTDTARKRGTSVYLPDRVIPMLPEVLSNSLASLQAGHVAVHHQRLHGVQRRRHPHRPPVRPVGDPGRPPVQPTKQAFEVDEGPRGRAARRRRARGRAHARRRCSSWR